MRLFTIAALFLSLIGPAAAAEPLHYRIGATFHPKAGVAAVDLKAAFPPVAAGEAVTLVLGSRFKIVTAEADGAGHALIRPTDKPWAGLQEVTFKFTRPVERPILKMFYRGELNPTGELPINQISPRLVEVSLDGMWLPILPDLTGSFTVEAVLSGLPVDAVVAAQGRVLRQGDRVFVSRDVPDIDFAFAASPDLRVVEGKSFTLYTADPDSPLSKLYSEEGARARAYLNAWLGDGGSEPIKLAVIKRPRGSGYARRGYIVTTDQGQPLDVAGRTKFIAHELAHLWFSNANATTVERWLDESTAEYVGLRYVEQVFGKAERDRMLAAKRADAAKAPPLTLSSGGIYTKGPLLLFALEERIGRKRMDALLGEAARKHVGKTADFLALLAQIASADDARWFEAQLGG